MSARTEVSRLRPEHRPRRRRLHHRRRSERHGTTSDRSAQPGQLRYYFRFRRATPVEQLLAEHPQSVAICLHCLSTIAADPEPMCRGSGINRRAWRTECRRRLGLIDHGLVLALVARSSAHCARLALGGIGTRAARRAPSIHVAALEAPSVATE